MNRILTQALPLVTLLCLTSGCTTTIRNLTATHWSGDGIYVGYWEGDCKPVLGCDIGDGKVRWCELKEDNSLVCTEQESVNALLDRKAR